MTWDNENTAITAMSEILSEQGFDGLGSALKILCVALIVSDAHSGLCSAHKAVFGGAPWQRCQFHLQQNAQGYVPRKDMKQSVATELQSVFNAPNEHETHQRRAHEQSLGASQNRALICRYGIIASIERKFFVFLDFFKIDRSFNVSNVIFFPQNTSSNPLPLTDGRYINAYGEGYFDKILFSIVFSLICPTFIALTPQLLIYGSNVELRILKSLNTKE